MDNSAADAFVLTAQCASNVFVWVGSGLAFMGESVSVAFSFFIAAAVAPAVESATAAPVAVAPPVAPAVTEQSP